jgi:hypothetical protein
MAVATWSEYWNESTRRPSGRAGRTTGRSRRGAYAVEKATVYIVIPMYYVRTLPYPEPGPAATLKVPF